MTNEEYLEFLQKNDLSEKVEFIVEKRGEKWVVLDKEGKKVLGTHDTEEAAKKQLAAIEAAKAKMQERPPTTTQTLIFSKEKFKTAASAQAWAKAHDRKFDKVDETEDSWRLRQRDPGGFQEGSFRTIDIDDGIKAVIGRLKGAKKMTREGGKETFVDHNMEILSVGEWNGHKFTQDDLVDIVEKTNAAIHLLKPPLKLGHDENQKIIQNSGLPSIGWINRLKLVGDRIVAYCKGIPEQVFELFGKGYRRVSCEMLMNWRNPESGQRCRIISGLALLGADLPAVTNLKDIADMKFKDREKDCEVGDAVSFVFTYDKEEIVPEKEKAKPDPEKFVEREAFDKTKAALKLAEEREKRTQEREKNRILADADAKIKSVLKFITDKETMRVVPKQVDGIKAILEKAREPHVLAFVEGEKKDKSLLELIDDHLRALPKMTGLFQEFADGKSESAGSTLTESELIEEAEKLSREEKITFGEAINKVSAARSVKSETLKMDGDFNVRKES